MPRAASRSNASPALNLDRIREHLRSGMMHRLCLYDTVASTNARLRELAAAGATEGTVVLADAQTAGRGRGGKPWFSPPGVNLYASVLFRPALAPAEVPTFAFIAPLALTETIREYGPAPAIKWPNDVLVRRRKLAGALTELSTHAAGVDHVILGVGANLNVSRAQLRTGLGAGAQSATSLREILGHPVDRNAFAARFLDALARWYGVHRDEGAAAIVQAWRDLDILGGRRVEVRGGTRDVDGRALGIDERGYLRVEDAAGRQHRIVTGDVRIVE